MRGNGECVEITTCNSLNGCSDTSPLTDCARVHEGIPAFLVMLPFPSSTFIYLSVLSPSASARASGPRKLCCMCAAHFHCAVICSRKRTGLYWAIICAQLSTQVSFTERQFTAEVTARHFPTQLCLSPIKKTNRIEQELPGREKRCLRGYSLASSHGHKKTGPIMV